MTHTVAIQYPSFGPQHPPRLRAIAAASPDWHVVAMEMFKKDSDYEWNPITDTPEPYFRYTAIDGESAVARRSASLRRAVFNALDEISPDVLVVNGWGHAESQASLVWTRKRKCPTVLLSDSVYENLPRVWYKELYKKWLVRNCASAFVAGTPQARYAVRLGIPEDRVFQPGSCVIDNDYWMRKSAIARRNATQRRAELDLPDRFFICVARFLDLKNLPFVVSAFAEYRRLTGDRDTGLVIVGSGPEEANIRSAIRECGLDNVILPGFLQVDQLPSYYGLASCYIHPSSRFECWGLVVNEAMASGLPVLVSNMVGCAEDLVRNGINGYVFDPFDIKLLARQMADVMACEDDRRAMGRNSEKIVAGHSCEVGAANLWKAVHAALR